MKYKNKVKKILMFSFVVLTLQACGEGSSDGSTTAYSSTAEELFMDAGSKAMGLKAETNNQVNSQSRRERYAYVNHNAFRNAAATRGLLKMNLLEKKTLLIQITESYQYSENNIVALGNIVDDNNSAVTLVLNEGAFVGHIQYGSHDEDFEIKPVDGDIHLIKNSVGSKVIAQDHHEDDLATAEMKESCESPELNGAVEGEPSLAEEVTAQATLSGNIPVIDMLVAYTPNARAKQGGTNSIKALIQLGVADTNRALADSGVNMRVRLLGTVEVRQNETGNYSRDLSSLRDINDGRWDEVHALRDQLGADQVSLVGTYSGSGTAGIGFTRASRSSAFTIIKVTTFAQYTFSHELGHNLGLKHTDGYVNKSGRFRTIMAYGNLRRIRRYSNPELSYNGFRTGDARHNESSILNANAMRFSAMY